ncbi:ParA family protein [bacterium]|nr:ParA family protein [bacterium]
MSSPKQHRPRIVTSLNLKGGVGKTHLCWLIAGVCQERGKKCLVIDLDKQGNITSTLLGDTACGQGAEALFNPAIDPVVSELIVRSHLSHVDCIPGSFALEQFNMTAPLDWEGSGMEQSLVDPLNEIGKFYDYILLDCPADISLITYAALVASEFLMIPLETAKWGALGTQHVHVTYQHVRKTQNSKLKLLGYVPSRFKQRRTYQQTYLKELVAHFGDDAFETMIPDLALFEKSVNDRSPIVIHSPKSNAATIARQFFDEIETRCERLSSGSR